MAKQGMRDAECSIFVANIEPRVSEEVLWELFLQAGPIKSIHIPCDKESGKQKSFAFIEFSSSVSATYAVDLLDGIRLYNRELTVKLQNSETTDAARQVSSNTAYNFYKQFYFQCEELKRRPQTEPRRNNRVDEIGQRNHSFSHPTLNRSFSSPANFPSNIPVNLMQVLNAAGILNNSTPQSVSSPSRRPPGSGSSPYARSPPYGGSPPYGRSPSYGHPPSHGHSPSYGQSPPYSRTQPSNPSSRSSPHGYQPSNQYPYWR